MLANNDEPSCQAIQMEESLQTTMTEDKTIPTSRRPKDDVEKRQQRSLRWRRRLSRAEG